MIIADALHLASRLTQSETPRLDVELLLAEIVGRDRSYLYTWPDRALTENQQALFENWFRRREAGEPIAHILGRRGFWTMELEVSPATLIPRPDTELLVEVGLELIKGVASQPRILDMGTGTGALALAYASELSHASVVATDFLDDVVALAERNRQRLGLLNVRIQKSDWWGSVEGRYHLIVSNPPYIASDDPHLTQGDVRYEPRSALVADQDGLSDLRIIIAGAPMYLEKGGWLLLEHGWRQAEAVRNLLVENGFQEVFSRVDYGGNERISGGRYL